MCLGVRGVDELTGDEAVRRLRGKLICLGDGALHALGCFSQDQLRAVGLHQLAALDGHALGHDDDNAVAAGGRDGGQADAGIAGGRLNDDGAGLQLAGGFGVVDHLLCDAVLDGAGGIEVFQLGENLGLQVQFFFDMRQLQQRSLADELVCGSVNLRHNQYLLFICQNVMGFI